jgi:hypothetical protein
MAGVADNLRLQSLNTAEMMIRISSQFVPQALR